MYTNINIHTYIRYIFTLFFFFFFCKIKRITSFKMQPALSNIWKIPQGMKKPLRKIFVCKIFTLRKVVKSTFNNFKYKLKIKLANIGLFEVFVHRLQIFSYIRPLAFQVTICMYVCRCFCLYV